MLRVKNDISCVVKFKCQMSIVKLHVKWKWKWKRITQIRQKLLWIGMETILLPCDFKLLHRTDMTCTRLCVYCMYDDHNSQFTKKDFLCFLVSKFLQFAWWSWSIAVYSTSTGETFSCSANGWNRWLPIYDPNSKY